LKYKEALASKNKMRFMSIFPKYKILPKGIFYLASSLLKDLPDFVWSGIQKYSWLFKLTFKVLHHDVHDKVFEKKYSCFYHEESYREDVT